MSFITNIFGGGGKSDKDDGRDSTRSAPSGKSENADQTLKHFLAKSPKGKYTLDSERGAAQSELCRVQEGERQKECIMVQMQSTRLFQAMQDNGFFCVLPIDPTQTHIECTPKP